jgi:hypothetical protein
MLIIRILFIVAILLPVNSYSQPKRDGGRQEEQRQGGREQGGGPPGGWPPREAFTACQNKSEGASCSFQSRRGQISGKCRDMRREGRTHCVPMNHRGGNSKQRPPDDNQQRGRWNQ